MLQKVRLLRLYPSPNDCTTAVLAGHQPLASHYHLVCMLISTLSGLWVSLEVCTFNHRTVYLIFNSVITKSVSVFLQGWFPE